MQPGGRATAIRRLTDDHPAMLLLEIGIKTGGE